MFVVVMAGLMLERAAPHSLQTAAAADSVLVRPCIGSVLHTCECPPRGDTLRTQRTEATARDGAISNVLVEASPLAQLLRLPDEHSFTHEFPESIHLGEGIAGFNQA